MQQMPSMQHMQHMQCAVYAANAEYAGCAVYAAHAVRALYAAHAVRALYAAHAMCAVYYAVGICTAQGRDLCRPVGICAVRSGSVPVAGPGLLQPAGQSTPNCKIREVWVAKLVYFLQFDIWVFEA